ncbi:MAG TPA: LLM class flavin-dependent oxidoreductase [Candidatus Limnocylindria bacterium]
MKIGLMLPMGAGETTGFAALRELAVTAEESGLDSVWGADHLIYRGETETEGLHECWTVLTAVAAVTSRVEIGPMVLALPFRNPALTAKMAAELDEVSGGRLILGLGCGWHEPEFDAFGYPFDHRVGRFEEGVRIIAPLLRGERITFEGKWHRVVDAELLPRPVRPGGPPILIAGKRPRMLRIVAEQAAQWNGAWFGFPEQADELRIRLANVADALEAAGREPATLTLTAGILVAFEGAKEDDAKDAIRGTESEIADALADYAVLGISHLIAHVFPPTPESVAAFGSAAALARTKLKTEVDRAGARAASPLP